MARKQRQVPIAQAEALFKSMRLRGLDEEALRQFVCKYSGNRWEEFYEALFGYEAKIQARQRWGRDRSVAALQAVAPPGENSSPAHDLCDGHQHQASDPGLRARDVVGDAEACHGRSTAVLAIEAEGEP